MLAVLPYARGRGSRLSLYAEQMDFFAASFKILCKVSMSGINLDINSPEI
jgi:hypothetical protein